MMTEEFSRIFCPSPFLMKKTSSPLAFFPRFVFFLALLLFLAACTPPSQGETPPDTLPTPTEVVEILPTDPPPTAPPADTPTPLPTEIPTPLPPIDFLQIVLTNANTDLLLWRETDGALLPILPASGATDLRLSDDGTLIAYRKDLNFGQQELWVVNTEGTNPRLLLGVEALRALEPAALGILIHQYEWIPNTHTLAFNTLEYIEAPGLFLNDDLHFLDVDLNELTTQLTAGSGGNFVFSPDGQQYALIGQNNDEGLGTISLLNTDGSNIRDDVLTYPYVLTYSEYQYYAEPVWSPDSTFLRVAIPPQDSLGEPEATTLLWEIPTDGSLGVQLGEILTQPFFIGPVQFSPDLTRLAYTRIPDPTDFLNAELVLANADGTEETVFISGNVFFNAWSPDSQSFVFELSDLQETYWGIVQGSYTLLTESPYVWDVTWIDATRFLFTTQTDTGWQLHLGTLGEPGTLLLEQPDRAPFYDFDN